MWPQRTITVGGAARVPLTLAAALVMALFIGLTGEPSAIGAPSTTSATHDTFRPVTGPVFTDPTQGKESPAALRIVTLLDDLIENTPPGSDIRIATMRLNISATASALVAAHQRGVTVRIVLPERYRSDAASHTLRAELNRRRRADDNSYVVFCWHACLADRAYSEAHSKLYMFSASGTGRRIVVTSSSNITTSGYHTAFNDAFSVVDNRVLYSTSVRYFDTLHHDRTPRRNPYTVASTGPAVMKYFPDTVTGKLRDAVSSIFNNIHCRAAGRSGDGAGHTVVDLIQPEWSPSRSYVIDRLVQLRRQGCRVRVITTRGGPSPPMLRRLARSPLPVRYSDEFAGDSRTVYAHSKYIAISGGFYRGRSTRTVFTGSTNMTLTGTRSSDNTMLRIRNDGLVYAAYAANFEQIWKGSQPLTRSTPAINTAQRRASRTEP